MSFSFRHAFNYKPASGGRGNLVKNGTFSNDISEWTEGTTTDATHQTDKIRVQNVGAASGRVYQAIDVQIGVEHTLTVDIIYNGGFARVEVYNAGDQAMNGSQINENSSGTYTHDFTPTVTPVYVHLGNRSDNNMYNEFDNVRVEKK